jgi:hypothetical protein
MFEEDVYGMCCLKNGLNITEMVEADGCRIWLKQMVVVMFEEDVSGIVLFEVMV